MSVVKRPGVTESGLGQEGLELPSPAPQMGWRGGESGGVGVVVRLRPFAKSSSGPLRSSLVVGIPFQALEVCAGVMCCFSFGPSLSF